MREERRLASFGVLVLAAVACGEAGGRDEGGSAARSSPPVAAAGPSASGVLPDAGGVWAWPEGDGLVSLLANRAPRGDVLGALASAGAFTVVVGERSELEELLTLRVEREPIEVVLARVVAGVPHALRYEDGHAAGTRRLATVMVGLARDALTGLVEADAPPEELRDRRLPRTAAEEEKRAARAERLYQESLANLESRDPERRSESVRWLDVNRGDGLAAALDRLANDESPEVRAAAAEALLDADTGAVQPLLRALDDPDPGVVLAALDALEFVGDESTVSHLEPLLQHRDGEVRERAVEAIEFLE